jgi:hypothetical protein
VCARCSTKPAQAEPVLAEQPAAAGKKRPVAEVAQHHVKEVIDLCGSSDDEDKPLCYELNLC